MQREVEMTQNMSLLYSLAFLFLLPACLGIDKDHLGRDIKHMTYFMQGSCDNTVHSMQTLLSTITLTHNPIAHSI